MLTVKFPVTNQELRHEVFEGELWFHAGDVCKILGLTNAAQTIDPLDDENKRKLEREYQVGMAPWFIDEEALYTVALGCRDARKPGTVAYQFRKWVIGVIKTIRKTGQYTATESDQQYFEPFGITLERKIGECDRAIAAATVGEGKIPQLAKDRKVLESLYRSSPKPRTKVDVEDTRFRRFILNYRELFGDERLSASEMIREAKSMKAGLFFDVVKDICFVEATKQFVPHLFGKFLQSHREVVVEGWKLQKRLRAKDGQRWAVVKA